MDLECFRALLTPFGQQVLQAAQAMRPQEVNFLRDSAALSRQYPSDLAKVALEIAILRGEASVKFPFADQMYFTRPALEQASTHEVSAYRMQRYRPFERLADLGCSIGADTLALAALAPTLALDLDPLRLAMAQANLRALGLGERAVFIRADLRSCLPFQPSSGLALFFDPARRANGRRIFSVHDYQPALSLIQAWLPRFPAVGVKVSPGVKLEELGAYEAEIEFISLHGELKEAALWFGPFKTARRRATVLPGPHTLTASVDLIPLSEPRAYIYEPDPSILRAGLVATLGAQLDAAQLDPDIAYLTADALQPTPFARAWVVEDWFPLSLKRLRSALRDRRVGRVTVKKRGSPLQPEALIRDLKLKGDQQRVVFLTHLRGRPIVILSIGQG